MYLHGLENSTVCCFISYIPFSLYKHKPLMTQCSFPWTMGCSNVWCTFQEAFLPRGYPGSVSEDYLAYQFWDTVQVGPYPSLVRLDADLLWVTTPAGILLLHHWDSSHTSHLEGCGCRGQLSHTPCGYHHMDVERSALPHPLVHAARSASETRSHLLICSQCEIRHCLRTALAV